MLLASERFKVLNCGRRFGKTVLSLCATVEGHGPLVDGKPLHPGAIHGAHIWWLAPIYKQSLEVWDILKRTLGGVGTVSETEWRITLPGGGWIQVRSADNPDNLRGSGLDGVVLDEAASMAPEVWSTVIRPALADRQGWAIFCSTPKGAQNWFHDIYEAAAGQESWVRWTRTTLDNSYIARTEIDAMLADMSEQEARQELYADFLVLAEQRFSAHAIASGRRLVYEPLQSAPLPAGVDARFLRLWELPSPGSSYIAYTDPALGVRRDYTTTLVAELISGGVRHVATLRERELEPSQHGMQAVALSQWYNNALWGCEAAKGEAVLYAAGASGYPRVYRHPRPQTLKARLAGPPETTPGLPMTGQTRTGFVEDLALWIDSGRYTSFDGAFWDECATFVIDGRGRAAAMDGKHDDLVMAAVGLVQLAQSPGAMRPMRLPSTASAPRTASLGGVYAQWKGR